MSRSEESLQLAPSTSPGSWSGWRALALLGASLLPHLPSVRGPLLFDDELFIAKNASIYSLANIPDLFSTSFPPDDPGRGLYRPLTALSYALDIFLGGGEVLPEIFHFTQLLLYFGVGVLVWRLLVRLIGEGAPALLGALLFMVHPVHCEVVDALSGRSELLGLLFSLLSLCLFWGSSGSLPRQVGAVVCYSLGCLAKESAVVLPGVLLGVLLLLESPPPGQARWRVLLRLLPFLLFIPLYVGWRAEVLGRLTPLHTLLGREELSTRWLTMGAIYLEYLRMWIIPTVYQVDFYYQHQPGVVRTLNVQAGMGLVSLGLSILALGRVLAGAWLGRLGMELPLRLMGFGLLFYLVFLFPVSHVVPFGALMAERFLFSPSVGWVIIGIGVWVGWGRLYLGGRVGGWLVVVLVGLLGVRSWVRAGEWASGEDLNRSLAEALPSDIRAQRNLMAGLVDSGEFQKAVELGEELIEKDAGYLPHHFNLGVAYLRLNRPHDAYAQFKVLVTPPHQEPDGWYGLALFYLQGSDLPRSREALGEALKLNPNYAQARDLLPKLDSSQKAAAEWRQTYLEEAEKSTDLNLVLRTALACRAVGDRENEVRLLKRVEELKRGVPPAP